MLSGQYLDSCSRSRRVLVGRWCSPAQVLACRQIFVNYPSPLRKVALTGFKSALLRDRHKRECLRNLVLNAANTSVKSVCQTPAPVQRNVTLPFVLGRTFTPKDSPEVLIV